jgi:phosphate starvation-inducible PhoH-like protein
MSSLGNLPYLPIPAKLPEPRAWFTGPIGIVSQHTPRGKHWTTMSDSTLTLTLDNRDEATQLFGTRDQYLRLVRDALGVRLIARGDTMQIEGSEEQVGQAERVFGQLRQMLRQQGKLTSEEVRTVLEVIQHSGERQGPDNLPLADVGKHVRPRTDGQGRYVRAMRQHDLTFCVGPGGTGKTYLAVGMAVSLLRQGFVKRIVLVRPAVEAGERLGFLPGDLVAKINPYLRPLFDALHDMMEAEQVKRYMENDIIEIVPLAYMRGRTLNQAVIILDEGQNTTVPQMKMFLTRMGQGSKIIVTGDITQVDLPKPTRSGLADALHRFRDIPHIASIYLTEDDIVRHPLVQQIVRAYEDDKPRRKKE